MRIFQIAYRAEPSSLFSPCSCLGESVSIKISSQAGNGTGYSVHAEILLGSFRRTVL